MERTGIYTVAFLVLRPTGSSCSYELVGRTVSTNVNVGNNLLVDISVSPPIPVQPGDVVGLHTVHARDEKNRFRHFSSYSGGSTYRVDISQNEILTGNSFSCSSAAKVSTVPIINVASKYLSYLANPCNTWSNSFNVLHFL